MNTACFQVAPDGGETFCKEGDSGAALVNDQRQLVGILQAEIKPNPDRPLFRCGVGIPVSYVFERLAALVREKEDANYPEKEYPHREFVLQLLDIAPSA